MRTVLAILSAVMLCIPVFAQKQPKDLPSIPWLPDPMMLKNEIPVHSKKQWNQQKKWVKDQLQKYFLGYMPPIPYDIDSEIIQKREDGEITIERVKLFFGKENKATMTLELFYPSGLEEAKPVFMTQWNHRSWIGIGLRRGYIGCRYAAADAKDDTKNYKDLYPDYSFMRLMQRAWGATAVVSYLHSRAIVDTNKIAISGHSRNGKQSMYVAAYDDRVDAVIPSSSGFGGIKASRLCDRRFSPHTMARTFHDFPDWFSHDLKKFVGHEDKLPVDMNSLVAIVAPRPCLLNAGIFDLYGDTYGLEQTYESVKKVYRFLNAPGHLQIRQVITRHTTQARDIENFFDFLDAQFGRQDYPPFNDRYHTYNYSEWRKKNKEIKPADVEKIDITRKRSLNQHTRTKIKKNIRWLLGEKPSGITNRGPRSMDPRYQREDDLAEMFRQQETIGDAERLEISPYNGMGDNLFADLYYPDTTQQSCPLVIYLHEYTYAYGYGKTSYPGFEMNQYIKDLTDSGFAVLAFDMIGFGSRQKEAVRFYERYPQWSLMGKMVEDVKAAIDVAYGLPIVDTSRIILSGYSLGAHVALFSAALDSRVNEVAIVDPFTPWRTKNNNIEGIQHFYDYFGLIPKLGSYEGNEQKIPVDLQEILSVGNAEYYLMINQKSRHIELNKMMEQIETAGKYVPVKTKTIPKHTHFYSKHRNWLIEHIRK